MTKKLVALLAVAALVALVGPAFANTCTMDQVPAATLLLPYFQVDLNNTNGVDTLFSINNASAAPQVAHVVLWTDDSIPTIDFDVYLTGYDVQTINLRDIFNGNLPLTWTSANDADDSQTECANGGPCSPHGTHPSWDDYDATNNPGGVNTTWLSGANNCASYLPLAQQNPALRSDYVTLIRQAHTGVPVDFYGGTCMGQDFGNDGIARGYITVDVVNDCNLLFPGDPGYFATPNGPGYAKNGAAANVLWGDYFYVDPTNNFAQGEDLVALESFSETPPATQYTFYDRYNVDSTGSIQQWNEYDSREPLGTTYATRYLGNSAPFDNTQFVVWRDSRAHWKPVAHGFDCGQEDQLGWKPLLQDQVVVFDEQEDATQAACMGSGGGSNVSPPAPFSHGACAPAETQLVNAVGNTANADAINAPYPYGWIYWNLNQPQYDSSGALNHLYAGQAWVMTIMRAEGRFSVGLNAIQMDTACSYDPTVDYVGSDPSPKIGL